MSRSARVGFTLVELLVVVTIIVVLLALLLPAMGQAVYQATLTKCSAQMKGIAHGATSYAMNNKRTYMNRMVYRSASFPYGLKAPAAFAGTEGAAAVDDRPIHKGYIEMKALIDPLSETVDLELDSDPNEAIYANYVLYYGFGYRGQTPMQRIGDRWTFTDRKVNPSVSYEFSWLVADLDIIFEGLHASAGHPDKAKRMYPAYAQAGSFEYASQQEQTVYGNVPVTYSFWRNTRNFINYMRGPMDLNFASDDGGVIRLTDVEYIYDDRIAHVPNVGNNAAYFARWFNIARP